MDYFLSGHGSSDTLETYRLPCELVIYSAFGTVLDIPTSWKIFDALAAGDLHTATGLQYRRCAAGTIVPAMTLYNTRDFTSGVFKVGAGKIPLGGPLSGGSTSYPLADFCKLFHDVRTVHWIACLS